LRLGFSGATCTGILLGQGRILTANHCIAESKPKPSEPALSLCIWDHEDNDLGCTWSFAVKAPPVTVDLDMAVLTVSDSLKKRLDAYAGAELSRDGLPMPLPKERVLHIAGAGCDKYWPGVFEGNGSRVLRDGVVRYAGTEGLRHRVLYLPTAPGAGACQGDSGGPLYEVTASGRMLVHGVAQSITMPGSGCSKKKPCAVWSKYTRLDTPEARAWLPR
jgi:hypothetical protein